MDGNEKDVYEKEPLETVDTEYNIESLIEKKGSTFLVKWENYFSDQNTWESRCMIPDQVIQVKRFLLSISYTYLLLVL